MNSSTLETFRRESSRHGAAENGFASARSSTPPPIALGDLAGLRDGALRALYAKGTPPDLKDLDGAPRGRMLAFAGPLGEGRAFEALRRFSESRFFPWAGKSFSSQTAERGRGVNRVRGAGDWFRFETSFGPSVLDGKPCLILDYDLPSNPWAIRQIHDELREVSSGLFLGPAMWKARPRPKLVLFFAIAT
jgi:hypothetical protein